MESKPTIVLVHGAWADASGYDAQIRALRERGHRVIGATHPLRELQSDAAYVAALLATIDGPIVLVGHSYGGAVISNAATGNANVAALVFLNGWVPDEGESLIELAQKYEGSLIPESLQPVPYTRADGSQDVDLYIVADKFRAAFAGDVDEATAQVMAAAQRPFSETAFGSTSGPVAWRDVPSWYLLGTEDRAIPPATQRFMAERAGAHIVEIAAAHASMISQPAAATDLILTAVDATAGRAVGAPA